MYHKQSSDLTYHLCLFRFLLKLSDQVVALISDEHSAKLVFQDNADDPSLDSDVDTVEDSDRLFDFEVKQTVSVAEGFKVRLFFICIDKFFNILKLSHPYMSEISVLPPTCPDTFDMERLQPKVIIGDMSQAILRTEYIPEKSNHKPIGKLRTQAFRGLLKYAIPFTSPNFR